MSNFFVGVTLKFLFRESVCKVKAVLRPLTSLAIITCKTNMGVHP